MRLQRLFMPFIQERHLQDLKNGYRIPHRMILNYVSDTHIDRTCPYHDINYSHIQWPCLLFHLVSFLFFLFIAKFLLSAADEVNFLFAAARIPPAFLELWPRFYHSVCVCVFSSPCSFCIFYTRSFLSPPHPTIPTSTESRPASYWPVSAFPLSLRSLVGSAHKGRASNHGETPVNPLQCWRSLYLHGNQLSQWRVSSAQDFDPPANGWGRHRVFGSAYSQHIIRACPDIVPVFGGTSDSTPCASRV